MNHAARTPRPPAQGLAPQSLGRPEGACQRGAHLEGALAPRPPPAASPHAVGKDRPRSSTSSRKPTGSAIPRRYLFGAVNSEFADENLLGPRQAGECIAFDAAGATDLAIRWDDTWESVMARLPAGWQPDFVVLHLPYSTVPRCLWTAPVIGRLLEFGRMPLHVALEC